MLRSDSLLVDYMGGMPILLYCKTCPLRPLHHASGDLQRTPGRQPRRQRNPQTENRVAQRHNTHRADTDGVHAAVGGVGANAIVKAPSQSMEIRCGAPPASRRAQIAS